ncbi:DNA mismatch repair protein MutS [Alphaproteobacteria bacterium]
MMHQYLTVKDAHRDYLLFYRMGDFYELFFDDAIIAAKELDIVLTKRGKHGEQDIPMCGVPAHSSEMYLQKLIKKGHSVAICEQLETPEEAKKRGHKAVVKREVVRIITPGTILEDNLLESKETNYLCSIIKDDFTITIAWIDISLGDFYVETIQLTALSLEVTRLLPKELIISDSNFSDIEIKKQLQRYDGCITKRANSLFEFYRCEAKLKAFYAVEFLSGIGSFSRAETIAAGALLEYIEYTQRSNIPRVKKLIKVFANYFMSIDHATRVNLELERSVRGHNKNSLLKILDKTLTASGGRLLAHYLSSPLANAMAINERLDGVESLLNLPDVRLSIRTALKEFPDTERALSRISAKRGTSRDLGIIRDSLQMALKVAEIIQSNKCVSRILTAARQITSFDNLLNELKSALQYHVTTNNPLLVNGGFVRNGYHAQLDKFYYLKSNSDERITQLRNKYKELTGITAIKILKNNVIGYFIEVTPSNASKMSNSVFIHRQSLGSAIRYTTEELKQLETEILICDDKIAQLEQEILVTLCSKVLDASEQIDMSAQSIAIIDVTCALAEVSHQYKYVRPIVDDSIKFSVTHGRHPVVERGTSSAFIPNHCHLNQEKENLWLITGPNMAGKSTFLRQNALICIMAQIGSFVPAENAHVGVVDKLFSRIGAADNISQGQSTFMVEMLETAYILNNATNRSFIILDEIGRGTATYDGLAIAWSVIENLHNQIKARTLFATHYHELTALEATLDKLSCWTMKVREWENKIIFMHEVISGKADKSYGIHVAELAGMPTNVIQRAYSILDMLTKKNI